MEGAPSKRTHCEDRNMDANYGRINGLRRQLLIVDDDPISRAILGNLIGDAYDIAYAENGREALTWLERASRTVSLVLLDLMMPVMDGVETLKRMKESETLRQIPVIVLTSEGDAEAETLRGGATDFITKPYKEEIVRARIARTIELVEDRQIIQTVETDRLTGLYSKDFFFEYAGAMVEAHPGIVMDALVLDLDHFHLYNEMRGRAAGDQLLCALGEAIRQELNGTIGIGCRCQADTFFVYIEHTDAHASILERITARVTEAVNGMARVRMGVCTRTDITSDLEGRFDRAKSACNRIRGDYLHALAYYDDSQYEQDIHAQRLINETKEALRSGQFKVYYQPKYDITGSRPTLMSAEALVRWQHPEFGIVSPGLFIPLFEDNGMIRALDSYVWKSAARQVAEWRKRYGRVIPVSVNVSRIDLFDESLLERLNSIREENELPPEALILEITESAYTEDTEQAIAVIASLRAAGYRIEMDDFGSGYSSLNMLLHMPVDALKIDGAFMRAISVREKDKWLIATLVDIARHLNVPTVFEGVEEEQQVSMIREAGGQIVQGYYFSRPLPPEPFEQIIEKDIKEAEQC